MKHKLIKIHTEDGTWTLSTPDEIESYYSWVPNEVSFKKGGVLYELPFSRIWLIEKEEVN